MIRDKHDPLWAIRLAKRIAIVLAALAVFVVVLWVVWLLLPVAPATLELRLHSNADVMLGGSSLGAGDIAIGSDTLRERGIVVAEGMELPDIAARLFPGEEFRGEFGHDPSTLPSLASGVQCHFRSAQGWRVVRVFVFPIEDDQWLAVPVGFHDPKHGRVHTATHDEHFDLGWSLTRSLTKRSHHEKSATILSVDGAMPEDDEITIGGIEIK